MMAPHSVFRDEEDDDEDDDEDDEEDDEEEEDAIKIAIGERPAI